MKNILFTALLILLKTEGSAQNKNEMEKNSIEQLVSVYTRSVDAQDFQSAEKHLHQDFRVVLNNHNGSSQTVLFTKEQYLGMMKSGKVGGDNRSISFLLVDQHENAAIVRVQLSGSKNTFTNYYSLIKQGPQWLIVQDIPQIVSKAPSK